MVGVDPELVDPARGDFRPGPAATGYGCQTFLSAGRLVSTAQVRAAAPSLPDVPGLLTGRSNIEVSGAIAVDTVWDADTVRVVGSVAVGNAVTLTIAAGTRVEFADFHRLTVMGRLLAVGSAEAPIVFTTDEPYAFAPDSTMTGCWNGIRFPWTSSLNEESRLEHCVIEYSKALGAEPWGGALSVVGFSKLLVRNCILRDNVAVYGGAVFCSFHAAPVLAGNLIEGNTAFLRGSAIYSLYSYPDVTNCTIVSNPCLNDEPFDGTGAIHNHISKSRVTSSIVRYNPSAYFIPTQILEGKAYYTTFSNLEFGHEGEGNIDEYPYFVGMGEHPFALFDGSLCIDAGAPDTSGMRLSSVDISGRPRVDAGRIDMGSYEASDVTGVDYVATDVLRLTQSSPNPFRGETTLSFISPGGWVRASVHDLAGREVRTLFDGTALSGELSIRWDGTDERGRSVASGIYFCRVAAGGARAQRKMVMLK